MCKRLGRLTLFNEASVARARLTTPRSGTNGPGLQKLAIEDNRKVKVVELRYFSGFDIKETAELLNVSEATVARDWRLARAWLRLELGANSPP